MCKQSDFNLGADLHEVLVITKVANLLRFNASKQTERVTGLVYDETLTSVL